MAITKLKRAKMFADGIVISLSLWLAVLSLMIFLTMGAAKNQANIRVFKLNYLSQPLPDVIHDHISPYFFDNQSLKWHEWSDSIILFQIVITLLSCGIYVEQPLHLAKRFVQCYCLLLLMRLVTFTVTTIPTALPECVAHAAKCISQWERNPNQKCQDIDAPAGWNPCNDFIFSGHTTTSWLLMLFYYVHIFKKRKEESALPPVLMFVELFCALATLFVLTVGRVHYTVDVVLALYFVCFVMALFGRSF